MWRSLKERSFDPFQGPPFHLGTSWPSSFLLVSPVTHSVGFPVITSMTTTNTGEASDHHPHRPH